MRREWIEILLTENVNAVDVSPSMRREWIEISQSTATSESSFRLPPCGGSGLKCLVFWHRQIP